jgi:segregation and condensation protein A
MTYKVDLDIYNGPMDLLLYLIRREEVDIRDVSIARIADQYIAYLDLLKGLDIDLVGDFLVMAATLLELKSRALLPRPEEVPEGEDQADLEEDPRETLIRQLLEYRRFKEVAAMLDERGREMLRRFPRPFDDKLLRQLEAEAADAVPDQFLKGVEVWDLVSAFSACLRTLGYSQAREVIYDDTPVEEAAKELLARIEAEKSLLFTQLFTPPRGASYLVTMFLAVLELVRQRRIGAEQAQDFKDVRLFLRDPAAEAPVQETPRGAEASLDALQRKAPRRPTTRQLEQLRGQLEEPDLEKTEFDEILESIQVPDVETYKPLYSEEELLGQPPADAGEGAAGTNAARPQGAAAAAAEAPDAAAGVASDVTAPPPAPVDTNVPPPADLAPGQVEAAGPSTAEPPPEAAPPDKPQPPPDAGPSG